MGLNRTERTERVSLSYEDIQHRNIPIVFHIFHTNNENNVPNATIYEAVEDINLAFGAIDYPYLNEESVDAKISFCLPLRDPEGNPTSGINRYDMSGNSQFVECGVRQGPGGTCGVVWGDLGDMAVGDSQR